ncbi:MAG: ERAP1-like C-terminal domain-containing protein [Henriciella sp.]|nr:ERAP1-like C-terminal domain-containing protein [Henriciella sp.]MBO6695679.1 ERAP1-like C-terminal domain-containing protein [Henriciella sp.]
MLTKTFRSWLFAGIAGTLVLSGCTRGGDDVTFDQVPPILQDVPPAGQLPEGVTPTAYRLDLFTDPAQDEFSGTVEIDITLDEPHARIWLHSVDHDVSSAFVVLADGTRLDAEFTRSKADGGVSRLDFETPVPQGNSTLTMTYAAPYNFNLSGLYKAEQNGRPYLATQIEPIDARRLVPSFDEPRFKTPWTLTVATPAGNQVVTNGALKAQTVRDDGNIEFQFATTREIQSYLVALAVGPYDLRDGGVLPPNGIRPRAVPFRGFSPSGKGDKLENAMAITDEMVTWQEAYFDYPYPYGKLDLIAVPDFAYGAMENDSLASARQIRNPIDRNADILDAFDSITYRKGGGVLSMFENYLGEEAFRDGIRLHMRRFEDGVADVDDFMTSIADGSKTPDVVESFNSFIMQPGIPYLDIEFTCPAPDAGLIRVSQSRYARVGSTIDPTAQTWVIPLAIKMNGANGERTVRQIFSGSSMEVPLDGGCPDWVLPNADGAGYWRFALNESAWQNLITNYDQLSAAEQLSFIDSATAAFTSGDLSASTLLQAIAVNANGSWSAALDPLSTLNSYLDVLPDEVSRDAFRDFVRAAYDERWNRLASSPASSLSEGEQLLKTSLSSALINMDRLDEERARLAAGAAAYVGVINSPDPSALTPDLVQTAIRIAAENDDGAFFQAALDYAESATNQRERRQIFYTLARKGSEADTLALMDLVLTDAYEGQLTWGVYLAALQNETSRAATWEKFKTDFEQVIAKTPEIRKPQTARLVSYFCTSDEIDDAIAFVETQASLIPGYERRLAQASETARLCAAFRAEKGTELAAALEAL